MLSQSQFMAGCRRSCDHLPSKQAVAGSSPVSRSRIYIVSLLAGEKPPGDNQAVIWQARRRCFYVQKGVQRHPASFSALPHEKSAFGLFTKSPPLEVVSTSATRSPPGSCSFAQRTEVAIMRSLRQIFHEANGGVAVVLAERFRIRPFQRRQTWE